METDKKTFLIQFFVGLGIKINFTIKKKLLLLRKMARANGDHNKRKGAHIMLLNFYLN